MAEVSARAKAQSSRDMNNGDIIVGWQSARRQWLIKTDGVSLIAHADWGSFITDGNDAIGSWAAPASAACSRII